MKRVLAAGLAAALSAGSIASGSFVSGGILGSGGIFGPGIAAAQTAPEPDPDEKPAPKAEEIPEEDDGVVRYPPSSVRLPLIIGGIVVLGAAYGLTAATALTWDDVPGADESLIPVAGPWIALAMNDCAPDDPDCGAILWLRGILYIVDGFAQLGGLGLLAEGIFMTTEADAPAATSWSVSPVITPRMQGFGVTGTF